LYSSLIVLYNIEYEILIKSILAFLFPYLTSFTIYLKIFLYSIFPWIHYNCHL
jgi:hypothetical protein